MPKGESLKPFMTKIAGVAHKNSDGTNRQEILKQCNKGGKLTLIHEPVPQDENAVKVCRENGEQIGWLNQILAIEIAPRLDKASRLDAQIVQTTGGGLFSNKARGCNIQITKYTMK